MPIATNIMTQAIALVALLVGSPNPYKVQIIPDPSVGAWALPGNQIAINSGMFADTRDKSEVMFVIAHELSHLQFHHIEKQLDLKIKILTTPMHSSGLTFLPWTQKVHETEADLNGQKLYLKAGGDPRFFSRTLDYIKAHNGYYPGQFNSPRKSLSPLDPHYSMADRFELLTNNVSKESKVTSIFGYNILDRIAQEWLQAKLKATVTFGTMSITTQGFEVTDLTIYGREYELSAHHAQVNYGMDTLSFDVGTFTTGGRTWAVDHITVSGLRQL